MTKAQQPFGDIDPFEMESYLNEGYRLHQPLNCPDQLYSGENYLYRIIVPLYHSRGYFNLMNGIFRPIIFSIKIVSGDIKRSYWIDFHYSSSSLLGNPSARTRNRSIYPHDFGLDAETITAICLKIASAYTKIKCNWFYTAIWSSGLSIILQTIESIKLIVLHFFTSDQTRHYIQICYNFFTCKLYYIPLRLPFNTMEIK